MNTSVENSISVLLVGTSFPSDEHDWRGRFLSDMVEALASRRKVLLNTWVPPGVMPPQVKNIALPEESFFLWELMQAGGIAHIVRNRRITGLLRTIKLLRYLRAVYNREPSPDVMHINWLQNVLPLWRSHKPALITVLGTDYKFLNFPGMISMLRAVIKQRKTIIAPNAHWMGSLLDKHFGDIALIRPIPFGVQRRWFNIDRLLSTGEVNHWLMITRLTANKIGPLFEWGNGLFNKHNRLYLLGPNQENLSIPEWIQYMGATYPEELAEKWFPTATGLITLSRHDEGRPQVILEAMAAGIPIIASDLSAHQDVVIHRETGWLVNSAEDLKQAIQYMSIPENNLRMGIAAKNWIIEHIGTWDDCAQRYEKAYMELTGAII